MSAALVAAEPADELTESVVLEAGKLEVELDLFKSLSSGKYKRLLPDFASIITLLTLEKTCCIDSK